jgi:steroid delta-isomerase-like uncharacterized protein
LKIHAASDFSAFCDLLTSNGARTLGRQKGAARVVTFEKGDEKMAQDNATIARQLYQDWNKREFDHFASLFASSGEIVLVGSGTRFRGQKGAKEFANMWADGFPDGKVKIDKLIAADTSVVVQYTGKGTHTGTLAAPAGDIPATGRSVTLELCDVIQFRDGKIKSLSSYFDSASLLMQLGVLPEARIPAHA